MKAKKIILLLIIVALIVTFFIFFSLLQQDVAEKRGTISTTFPESYKPYIEELKKQHPNWTFKALYTDMDWSYVIGKENVYGKNLVPKSYSDSWKNTASGKYNVEIDSGWVDSSKQAVEYAMDPRNFLNSVRVFQFEELSYNSSSNTTTNIEKILYGTEFYNKIVEYKNASGSNIVTNKKYSDLILTAAKTSDVSGFHLASRIKQEVGPFLSHSSISGTVPGYEGLYNFYNIGATSSSEPMGAIKNGLKYAKDGKGASSSTKAKYLIPWNTKERAITGGAIFIGSSYINLGQNTIYLQKFHVIDNSGEELFWHQYMTNVLAPYSESQLIYNGYSKSQMLNTSMSFIVPIYNNLPSLPCISPAINTKDYIQENKKVYANVSGSLNIRTGPSTSYEILTSVKANEQMTRIAKGKQSGELWDRVILQNGLVGYVFQNYVKEVQEIPVQKINLSLQNTTLQKGQSAVLSVEVLPSNATDKTLSYTSSNPEVVSIDSSGKLFAIRSGTSTITAKSKNNVSSSIKVTVYSKVTGLELEEQDLCLQVGQTYKMTPLVLPEDANNQGVDFYSSKPLVANINTSGLITALSEGNTQIKVVTKEGSFEKVVTVTVIPKLEENAITFSKPIQVNGNQLTGIEERTTVKSLLSKITTKYRVEIINKSGKILTDDDLIGTNSKVRMYDNEQLIIEYGIILYGDLNGDGKINSIDLLVLQRHILELKRLEGLFLKAGNIGQNGKAPSSVDLLKIQRHILNLKKIEQSINTIINEKVINQKETATIKLTSNKQNVEANEEFTVSVNTENINVGACAIKFYYDQSKLELTTKNENINVGNNSAIYTWFDEEGAKNIDENKSIASLNFKAKEDGINLISFEGEFYNEKEEKILPNVETLEVKVGGKEQQEPIIEESTDEANSNLAVLRLDKEGINPLFENNIKEYYIIVNENVDNIDVTAIPENKNASVKITGNKNLKNGMNTILVKVTSQNKKNVSEYKIYVTKTNDVESANANLETLAIENVLLSPEFNKNITNYKGEVNNDVATLNILAIPESQNANVKIAGGDNLKEGNNNITITVYAPNNITFRKYQINIYKKSIKEQEKQMQISNNNDNYNYNVDSALTIDNSKQVQEMRDETMQRKAENYLWIIIIALAIIVGSGITVIIIYRKNKNRI